MDFKEFINKYGTDTTSNFQLIKWAKELNIKPFYYCMRDEIIPTLKTKKSYFTIVNIHTSKERGIHHSALYKNSLGKLFFFDSYGLPPTEEIINLQKNYNPILYSEFQIQEPNTKWCGQLSLWVLYQITLNKQFENIILDLKKYV